MSRSATRAAARSHRAALVPDGRLGTPPREPRGTPRPSRRGKWRALSLVLVHLAVLAHVLHWLLSDGATLTPLEPSEAGETLTEGLVNAGFLLLVGATLATLLLGRFFCGWACHVVAYQDGAAWLLGRFGLRPTPVRSRVLLFVPLFAALELFVFPSLFAALDGRGWLPSELRWHLTTDDLWARFPGLTMGLATLLVDGFLIVWLLGSKAFCSYGCPYGAIFSIADRRARGRIVVDENCEGCGHCTSTCTSNVDVAAEVALHGAVVDPGCMKCMDCVSVCPKDALSFGFRGASAKASDQIESRKRKQAAPPPQRRRWDFSWPEELVLGVTFFAALYAWRALYGAVPFLLAVGVAVITAVAAVLLLRFTLGRELELQGRTWVRQGRRTRAGWIGALSAGALVLLTAHSAAVQVETRRGQRALAELQSREKPPTVLEQRRRAAQGLEALDRALRWGLFEPVELRLRAASLANFTGDRARAEALLVSALASEPERLDARLHLADVRIADGRPEEALEDLRALQRADPGSADVARRLGGLIDADLCGVEPYLLFADVLLAREEPEATRGLLQAALARYPGDPEVTRRLAELPPAPGGEGQ